jgi:ABC-type Fe3+-hydroxamate transport system substrate-binding protein
MRVVSLVPSATESLVALGVRPVAVSRFCDLPGTTTIGGTKDPDIDAIAALEPDLVVCCVEENRVEDADALTALGIELHVLDIRTVDDVRAAIAGLADAVGAPAPRLRLPAPAKRTRRAFIPIWRRPWMSLAGDTYGSSVLAHLGIANVLADVEDRYPQVELDDVIALGPDLVVAPDEPYPFGPRQEAELSAVAPVRFVDGRDVFWWGTRTPAALTRLAAALA